MKQECEWFQMKDHPGIEVQFQVEAVGDLSCGRCRIETGYELPVHTHTPDEIYIILKGFGLMLVGEEVNLVDEGKTIFVPGNVLHGIKSISEEPLEFNWIFPTHTWGEIQYNYRKQEDETML